MEHSNNGQRAPLALGVILLVLAGGLVLGVAKLTARADSLLASLGAREQPHQAVPRNAGFHDTGEERRGHARTAANGAGTGSRLSEYEPATR